MKLYLISDSGLFAGRGGKDALLGRLAAACRQGVWGVQLREQHRLDDGPLLALAREAAGLCVGTTTRLYIGGRPDIALACGAVGVHLGTRGVPAGAVGTRWPGLDRFWSAHDRIELDECLRLGIRRAVVGPVFTPRSKPDAVRPALGLDAAAGLIAPYAGRIECFALGGIRPEDAPDLARAGFCGAAVCGDFLLDPDPERWIERWLRAAEET